jgi:hypothetical protein
VVPIIWPIRKPRRLAADIERCRNARTGDHLDRVAIELVDAGELAARIQIASQSIQSPQQITALPHAVRRRVGGQRQVGTWNCGSLGSSCVANGPQAGPK